ncbi:hypothetical protein CR513_08345, partial [Mucuna pruriens]
MLPNLVNISAQISSISILNGMNFKVWKEAVVIELNCIDLELALQVEKLILTPDNLQEKRFRALFLRVKDKKNVREYIMEMSNLAAKLKSLKLELGEDLIVHLSFKVEVELQLGKKIKAINSDRGGEYYDRYDKSGEQHLRPFAFFLRECEIVPQYTMLGKPSMNGVTERKNWILKDMKEGIDYKETFYTVSSKDSFRTVMILVAHSDLELHQVDVKTVFLNGDIDETIYMMQPENLVSNESKSMK